MKRVYFDVMDVALVAKLLFALKSLPKGLV